MHICSNGLSKEAPIFVVCVKFFDLLGAWLERFFATFHNFLTSDNRLRFGRVKVE